MKNFNEAGFLGADCKDEIHTVAKGAIRAVLARLVADQQSNPLILQINPDAPETQKRAAYRRDACFDGSYNSANLGDYQPVPCKGFEHYIASVAVRSVAANQGVFQAGDLPLIFD